MFEVAGKPVTAKGDPQAGAGLQGLLHAVNIASGTARTAWLFFLALMGYFLVAIASVTHEALLLNKELKLPLLGIELDLVNFFSFAPLILLLVHFGLLVQHVMLSLKVIPLDEAFTRAEAVNNDDAYLRLELNSYFYTQALAGQRRSPVFGFFLHAMIWLSFVMLPIVLFLLFQITFLPYHDVAVTWAHRIYLMVDVAILTGVGIFLRKPEASFWRAVWRTIRHHPSNFLSAFILMNSALAFSLFVATIPDEWLDKQTQRLVGFQATLPSVVETKKSERRRAFMLTALIFEGEIDLVTGQPKNWLHRNLIVTDKDLVPNRDDPFGEVSINLKSRDLRYARLDGSDLHRADLAGADLSGASLVETKLQGARISCPRFDEDTDPVMPDEAAPRCTNLSHANLTRANLTKADLRDADLSHARLDDAVLLGAKLQNARLQGASFQRTDFRGTSWTFSMLNGADLSWANFQGVDLAVADLKNAKLENADLRAANLSHANLQGANLSFAKLQGADLSGAALFGANLEEADFTAADLRGVKVWSAAPPAEINAKLADFRKLKLQPSQKAGGNNAKWKQSAAFQSWDALKAESEQRIASTYGSEISNYLVAMVCAQNWKHPAAVRQIIQRAASKNFVGDPSQLLNALRRDDCLGRDQVGADLMRRLIERTQATQ